MILLLGYVFYPHWFWAKIFNHFFPVCATPWRDQGPRLKICTRCQLNVFLKEFGYMQNGLHLYVACDANNFCAALMTITVQLSGIYSFFDACAPLFFLSQIHRTSWTSLGLRLETPAGTTNLTWWTKFDTDTRMTIKSFQMCWKLDMSTFRWAEFMFLR